MKLLQNPLKRLKLLLWLGAVGILLSARDVL